MPDALPLAFELTRIAAGHGADDYETDTGDAYTLRALIGSAPVGHVDFNDLGDTLRIRWIEVTLPRRRVATALLDELARQRPGSGWETGGFTEDGTAFLAVYERLRGRAIEERDDRPDEPDA